MFSYWSLVPSDVKGVIRVRNPIRNLGPVEDIDGVQWNVGAIIGSSVSACCESELHPYYSDTSGGSYGFVDQRWDAYNVEIVENN